jgi:hypothetical protein
MAAPGSPGNASTTAGEGSSSVRTTLEQRILAQLILGKEVKLDTHHAKVIHAHCTSIAKIAKHLLEHPSQIASAEVSVIEGNSVPATTGKGRKRGLAAREAEVQRLNADPKFDTDKVKTLSDVPTLWFWGFLRKHTPGGILDKVISRMSAKSDANLRLVIYFFTGRLDFQICGGHVAGSLSGPSGHQPISGVVFRTLRATKHYSELFSGFSCHQAVFGVVSRGNTDSKIGPGGRGNRPPPSLPPQPLRVFGSPKGPTKNP